jgi:hypothetical protein
MAGEGEKHELTLDATPAWTDAVKASHTVRLTNLRTEGNHFKGKLNLAADKPFVLPQRADHVVRQIKINGGDAPLDRLTVERRNDREADIALRFNAAPTAPTIVALDLGVLQPLGGNRDNDENRNISITMRYHAGPSGSANADSTALVLLMHEIGHALGMTPSTQATYYNNTYGGAGDHCSHNAQRVLHANLAPFNVIADGQSGEVMVPLSLINGHGPPPCIMYHTRTRVHHTSVFCDHCKASLRGDELVPKWNFTGA